MTVGITVSLALVVVVLAAGAVAYRRAMRRLRPDDRTAALTGTRLTSERLHRLASPGWRVVYEIAPDRLHGVDHVVIGPPGVIAVQTVVVERPSQAWSDAPGRIADAAFARGAVDELTARAGAGCELLAIVHWGSPRPDEAPATEVAAGCVAVEGQRLEPWLAALPVDRLDAEQIDAVWRAVVTGLGRPDPLPG